jgi:PAS domain S-box-containing protein
MASVEETHTWPPGSGTEAAKIRAHDWKSSSLDDVWTWPETLRTMVAAIQSCAFPMAVIWGPDRAVFRNDAFASRMRLPDGTEPAISLYKIWPGLRPLAEPLIERVLTGTSLGTVETAHLSTPSLDLPAAWFDLTLSPLRDDERNVAGVIAVSAAVAAAGGQPEIEATAAERDPLFGSFAEHSAAVLWISPLNHRGLSYLSRSFDHVFGESRARVLSDLSTWTSLVHPDDIAATEAAFAILRSGQVSSVEYRIIRPSDGKLRYIHDTGFPLKDATGQILHLAGIATDVTDRRNAEAALQKSDEKYRSLFNSVDQGFCLVEILFDGAVPVDYRFLETNAVFNTQTGLSEAVGRTALELVPELERWWIDTYASVAVTGQSQRFEHWSDPMGRCFDVFASRVGGHDSRQVAILFNDVTERRRADQVLQEREARNSFFLELTDALRTITDPEQVIGIAMRCLCHHLAVNRVVYFAIEDSDYVVLGEHSEGLEPVKGRFPTAKFDQQLLQRLRRGEAVVSSDTRADPTLDSREKASFDEIGVRAYIGVPWINASQLVCGLTIHSSTPRLWSESEVTLVGEVAQRTWAAVANAQAQTKLRDSEQRFRTLVEGIPHLVWRCTDYGMWNWCSPQWTVFTGQTETDSLGWGWLEMVHPEDRDVARSAWARAREAQAFVAAYRLHEEATGSYKWFQTRALPVRDDNCSLIEWLGASTDVHELHDIQERLKVLVAELQHRTRNLMAVVVAVTERTLNADLPKDDLAQLIRSRLGSISRANGLLARLEGDERVTFDALLDTVFDHHNPNDDGHRARIRLSGPGGICLRSSPVQILALALHEMALHAWLGGALTSPEGHVSVEWRSERADDGTHRLLIDWNETAGREKNDAFDSRAQHERQFVRELVENALPYQLGAITKYNMSSAGLECHIALPVVTPFDHAPGKS